MASYFSRFPKIYYDFNGEKPFSPVVVTNILARVKFRQMTLRNSFVYYPYDVKDGETPQIVAAKYYGDPELYWILFLANDIINPWYDWVLSYENFQNYITNKYGSIQAATQQVQEYQKIITKVDSVTGNQTIDTFVIPFSGPADEETYSTLPEFSSEVFNLSNGNAVTITTTTAIVYAYDFEFDQNEAKRKIKIIDKAYSNQIQSELKSLLAQ